MRVTCMAFGLVALMLLKFLSIYSFMYVISALQLYCTVDGKLGKRMSTYWHTQCARHYAR